jgi:hypothetical protein
MFLKPDKDNFSPFSYSPIALFLDLATMKNGLKQDVLSQLLFNSDLEYAIRWAQ